MNPTPCYAAVLLLLSFCLAPLTAAHAAQPGDAQPAAPAPGAATPEQAMDPSLPTLFLVGDSTLKSNAPQRGWASEVGAFLDTTKINIANRAIGGRSSKTFIHEGRWDKVLAELKPGDFVVVQFGHNDQAKFDDPKAKGRPSLPGEGEETGELTKSDGTTETVHTFGWYMRKYGSDARAKGATAIFCSMVPHKDWTPDGKIKRGERNYHVAWTRNAAAAVGAIYIDLNEIAAIALEKLGRSEVDKLFADARTHTSPEGAKLNARCFIAGMKALDNNPLAPYLNAEGEAVERADKAFAVPATTAAAAD